MTVHRAPSSTFTPAASAAAATCAPVSPSGRRSHRKYPPVGRWKAHPARSAPASRARHSAPQRLEYAPLKTLERRSRGQDSSASIIHLCQNQRPKSRHGPEVLLLGPRDERLADHLRCEWRDAAARHDVAPVGWRNIGGLRRTQRAKRMSPGGGNHLPEEPEGIHEVHARLKLWSQAGCAPISWRIGGAASIHPRRRPAQADGQWQWNQAAPPWSKKKKRSCHLPAHSSWRRLYGAARGGEMSGCRGEALDDSEAHPGANRVGARRIGPHQARGS